MIIVDASVTIAWCLADEADEYSERVLDLVAADAAAAPAHWPLEVANGLLTAMRRGRIDVDELGRVSIMLDRMGVEVVPVELTTAMWTVLDTAGDHGLSAYDAAYLDLARFRGARLATLDASLRSAAAKTGIGLVE